MKISSKQSNEWYKDCASIYRILVFSLFFSCIFSIAYITVGVVHESCNANEAGFEHFRTEANKRIKAKKKPIGEELYSLINDTFPNELNECIDTFITPKSRAEKKSIIGSYKCPQAYCLEKYDITANCLEDYGLSAHTMISNFGVKKVKSELVDLHLQRQAKISLYDNKLNGTQICICLNPNASNSENNIFKTSLEEDAYNLKFDLEHKFSYSYEKGKSGKRTFLAAYVNSSLSSTRCYKCHAIDRIPKYAKHIESSVYLPKDQFDILSSLGFLDKDVEYKGNGLVIYGLYSKEKRNEARIKINTKSVIDIERIYNESLINVLEHFHLIIPKDYDKKEPNETIIFKET